MFFFNGQRETSGYLRVDGLSANLGLPLDASNVPFSAGATPARDANGAANSVVSATAVSEAGFLAWQFRSDEALTPGRQVSLTTKGGSNEFHGSVFERFDGAALRANDWFANRRGLARPVANFDARHSLKGFVTYSLPNEWDNAWLSTLLRRWQISSLFHWRGATPVNLVYARLNGSGLTYTRPDVRPGANVYLPDAGRLRPLNAAAFTLPTSATNGNLPRNSLRGYGFAQVDVSLARAFSLTQKTSLTLRADIYNALNHANFVAPAGFDASLGTVLANGFFAPNTAFGQTRATANQDTSAGANFLAPYQAGGARSVRLALSGRF